jgi:hypothetical protein
MIFNEALLNNNSKETNTMLENTLDIAAVNQATLDVQRGNLAPQYGEGIVLLKNFSKGTTSGGKPKYSGVIANQEEANFQIWSNKAAFATLEEGGFTAGESVVRITYEAGNYGLILNTIELVAGYAPDDFIYHRYNINDKTKEFCQAIKDSGATDKAIDVIKTVLHMGCSDDVSKRVGREFAALSHHDNCETGLLAHMTKCIQLYNGIKVPYTFLKDERINDLMVIALAIHDIGKIYEMYKGTYQKYSFVTHRGLGMEHLLKHKDAIIESYDEEFFYMLYSVIQQHHDEYGEGARTLYAFLVHMIDDMDATLSSFDEMIQSQEYTTDEAGTKLKFNDKYFNL